MWSSYFFPRNSSTNIEKILVRYHQINTNSIEFSDDIKFLKPVAEAFNTLRLISKLTELDNKLIYEMGSFLDHQSLGEGRFVAEVEAYLTKISGSDEHNSNRDMRDIIEDYLGKFSDFDASLNKSGSFCNII